VLSVGRMMKVLSCIVAVCAAAANTPLEPAAGVAWSILDVSHSWNTNMRAIVTFADVPATKHQPHFEAFAQFTELHQVLGVSITNLLQLNMAIVDFPVDAAFSDMRHYVEEVMEEDYVAAVEADSVVGLPSHEEMGSVFYDNHTSPMEVHTDDRPNDPLFVTQWGFADMDMLSAWKTASTKAARRPLITVIDTGVDYLHPDLRANIWTNEAEFNGLPGVDDDGNGYIDDIHGWNAITSTGDPADDHWHGTHCAGTIGAVTNNNLGIAGADAPFIQGCKFLDSRGRGSTSNAITCIDYSLATNADITSNSWGSYGYSDALRTAVLKTKDRGQLFVAAAGNSGENSDVVPFFPAGLDIANVLAVAALQEQGGLASYSNYGAQTVHVAAPGSSIASTYPANRFAYASGTSMAAPHVSGVMSLGMSYNGELTYAKAMELMKLSVKGFVDQEYVAWKGKVDAAAFLDVVKSDAIGPDLPGGDYSAVLGPSTTSCVEICALTMLSCDEGLTTLINTDIDTCMDAALVSGVTSYWSKGTVAPELSVFPTGCYVQFRRRGHVVNINSNTFGTGKTGCYAPPAQASASTRVCGCV